mgnify:FL=1
MHIDTIAWFGSFLVLVSLSQRDAVRLHAANVVASLVFIVYDVALSLHPMIALNSILTLVSVIQIARLRWPARRRRPERRPTGVRLIPPHAIPDPTAAARR